MFKKDKGGDKADQLSQGYPGDDLEQPVNVYNLGGSKMLPPQIKPGGGVQGVHPEGSSALSQNVENEKKGLQNMMGQGFNNIMNNIKKATSQKSGGKGSQRSGGPGSVLTSLSDLEKIERIMNEAQHADKNVVKYFGKHFEEFRREMHYNKEIVFSDMLDQFGAINP